VAETKVSVYVTEQSDDPEDKDYDFEGDSFDYDDLDPDNLDDEL